MFDIFYNKKFRSIASQFTLILFLVVVFYYFINNAIINLDRLGITSGFDFLFSRAGYDAYSPFFKFTSDSLHIDAYFVGLLNTLSVSILGIFIATILGFIMGVLRLSNNWLVSKLVYLVVEFKRNVPVLIWIIIWYFGVFLQLPSAKKAININDSIFIVTVTDACGYIKQASVEISVTQYDDLLVSADTTHVCEDTLAQICVAVEGGEGNYTYSWSNGYLTECIEVFYNSDPYRVTVTDGCVTQVVDSGYVYNGIPDRPYFEYLPIPDIEFGIEFYNYTPSSFSSSSSFSSFASSSSSSSSSSCCWYSGPCSAYRRLPSSISPEIRSFSRSRTSFWRRSLIELLNFERARSS